MSDLSTLPDSALKTALTAFVAELQRMENTKPLEYKFLTPDEIKIEMGSKFARIVCDGTAHRGQQMVQCFVALVDGQTKMLGSWSAGDVLKAAGWKAPAKGTRGSIFNADQMLGYRRVYPSGREELPHWYK